MAKILLVEDDTQLTQLIADDLADEHVLEVINEGKAGLTQILHSSFDIAILDWNLPTISGIDICQAYRKTGGFMPVLMLTGKGDLNDKLKGFEAGVDDYLVKPFDFLELRLRIRALIKRCTPISSNILRARDIEIDPASHAIRKSGKSVNLYRTDFALLEFMMRNPNVAFSADALLDAIHLSRTQYSGEAIRSSIKRIRRALDSEGTDSIIRTLHRVGYRLEP